MNNEFVLPDFGKLKIATEINCTMTKLITSTNKQ